MLELDYHHEELYNMTLKELKEAVNHKRQGMGYFVWKLGSLSQWLKEYPKNPEEASPELYPQKPSIVKPAFLCEKKYKLKGEMMMYE